MTEGESIVALYWQRDEQAIARTKTIYGGLIRSIAYQVLADNSDCDEVENDTYLAAWNSMPQQRPQILSSYLGKIARQLAIDVYRKRSSRKRVGSVYAISLEELAEVVADDETPETAYDKSALAEAVNGFLASLPELTRTVFICRYFYFDDIKDIAACTGCTEAAIRTSLCRTRGKLREYLLKEGYSL